VPRWGPCGAEVAFGEVSGGRLRMTSFVVPAGAGAMKEVILKRPPLTSPKATSAPQVHQRGTQVRGSDLPGVPRRIAIGNQDKSPG